MSEVTVTEGRVLGTFDDPRYAKLAVDNAARYQGADPFPHGVYDNFLPEGLARRLAAEFPDPPAMEWVQRDNEHNRRMYQHDETKIPVLFRELNSRQFLLFIETLTGIDNLLPDPYFIGGGVHISGPGDFLNIHADFNWHHKLQAHRRVNALLYLTEQWDESWGGALEFWSRDMSTMVANAFPVFNRLVVFSTSEHSHHGQRVPNSCPEGTYRKVLNLYYYTTDRDDEDRNADPHFTMYKTSASPFATELTEKFRRGGTAQ
jgi:hypothetical protein